MGANVIILDQSKVYRDTFSSLLSEIGTYHISTADSWEEFVLIEKSVETVALIIIDIAFPTKAQGAQVLKRIRGNRKFASTPIVIVTELDESDAKGIGIDYSVVDYIVKPFKSDRFLNSISALLTKREDLEYGFSRSPAIKLSPMEYIDRELRIAARLQSSLSLVVISSLSRDGSSPIPDEMKGDTSYSPQLVLNYVRKFLRSTDQAFLSDKGDVLAVLPATEIKGAEKALKKIISEVRKRLMADDYGNPVDYYGVTVSYPQDGGTLNELMQTALTMINSKKQLEKVSTTMDKRMAKAHYIYRRNQGN